jgi:hypothetical protein
LHNPKKKPFAAAPLATTTRKGRGNLVAGIMERLDISIAYADAFLATKQIKAGKHWKKKFP